LEKLNEKSKSLTRRTYIVTIGWQQE